VVIADIDVVSAVYVFDTDGTYTYTLTENGKAPIVTTGTYSIGSRGKSIMVTFYDDDEEVEDYVDEIFIYDSAADAFTQMLGIIPLPYYIVIA